VLAAGAAWPGAPPAALATASLFALLAALAIGGWRLAALALPEAGGATRGTAAVVFATAAAILPAIALGHFGRLRPGAYLLVMAALAAAALLLPRAPRPVLLKGGDDPRRGLLRAAERALAVAAACALAAAALHQIREARYLPAGTFGFDDPSYHLTAVATWAERGDLAMVKFAVGDASTPYYPIAGELIAWVLLSPFGDSDFAARWAQLPFALAGLAAIASLAGRLGIRPRSLLPALVLYWSVPRVFPACALAAGNDHAAAFFLIAAADGALELARRRSAGAALYAGAALGLLVGTKYLGVLLTPLVLALYATARIADRRRAEPGGRRAPDLVAVAAAAVCGGYTYLRNWATAGNPIFPAPLTIAGVEVFPGWEGVTLAVRRNLPEFAIELPDFLMRVGLWGPIAPWSLVPAAVLAPLAALLLPRLACPDRPGAAEPAPRWSRWTQAALLLLPAGSFLVFLRLVHDHRDIRYFLGGVAVAAVGWAWLTDRLERSGPRAGAALAALVRAAACAAVLVAAVVRTKPGGASPLLLLAAAAAGALLAARRNALPRWAAAVAARPAAVAALAAALLWLPIAQIAERYPERKLGQLPLTALIESFDEPGGATIAYVGLNAPYHLWGSRLQNRVAIVPTGDDPADRVYDWGGSTRQPFRDPERPGRWIRNLERIGVSWVVVVHAGEAHPERPLIRRRPERFHRVATVGDQELWRFLPRGRPEPPQGSAAPPG
jgi:hypothetical protein